jgi:hypothetical protein
MAVKTLIERIEVASGGIAAITLNDIPQTYTDLYLVASIKAENTDNNLFFKFNNTASNTSWRNLLGYGAGVASQSGTGWLAGGGVRSTTANTFGNLSIYIPNYAGNTAKTASVDSVSEANETTAYQFLTANLWNDTAAITRIDLYLQSGEIAEFSSVALYGFTKGSDGSTTVS